MKRFAISLQFLTIIPLYRDLKVTEEDLGKSMLYFPLVGLLIGGCLVCSNEILSFILPPIVVDGLLVALLVLITGSIHLDGLVDTIDGIIGGKDKIEKLQIMKDEKVGAMGVVGVFLVLMLKYVALTSVPSAIKYQSLLLMPMIGRWSQVIVAYFSDYAGLEEGLGLPFTAYVTFFIFIFTTIISLLVAFCLLFFKGVFIVGLIGLFCFITSQLFNRSLGGVTGDILGATSEIAEVAVLIMILVRL